LKACFRAQACPGGGRALLIGVDQQHLLPQEREARGHVYRERRFTDAALLVQEGDDERRHGPTFTDSWLPTLVDSWVCVNVKRLLCGYVVMWKGGKPHSLVRGFEQMFKGSFVSLW